MNLSASDSDDSAFLFSNKANKKKHPNDVAHKFKKEMSLFAEDGKNELHDLNSTQDIVVEHGERDCARENGENTFEETVMEHKSENAGSVASNLDVKPDCDNYKFYEGNNQTDKTNDSLSQKTSLSCPLCLKSFDTDNSRISHMKQCGKRYKLTTKELVKALELHKTQLKQRIALGLTPEGQPILSGKRKLPQTTANEDRIVDPESAYELALGLALSKSLEDSKMVETENANDSDNAVDQSSEAIEAQKTTLEHFGFKSSGSETYSRKRVKALRLARSTLRERTKEERERLLAEKAAAVLLKEDKVAESFESTVQPSRQPLQWETEAGLWKMAESGQVREWYAQDVKEMIAGEEDKAGPGDNIDETIAKLPTANVSADWRKLVNNENFSDVRVFARNFEEICLHSVVLYARCPNLLAASAREGFTRFDRDTILSFLRYVYCGELTSLTRSGVDSLREMAEHFDYGELLLALDSLKALLKREEEEKEATEEVDEDVIICGVSDEGDTTNRKESPPRTESNHDLFEEEERLRESDFDVPPFDPYEHFNDDFPVASPASTSFCVEASSTPAGVNPSPLQKADSAVSPISVEAMSTPEEVNPSPLQRADSMVSPVSVEPPKGKQKMELLPARTRLVCSEDVTPLPDYSAATSSFIKKHLSRYGLKKSLSRNKAKKILRHIYEELHPMVNMKNGEVVKLAKVEKPRQTKKKGKTDKSSKNDKQREQTKDSQTSNEGNSFSSMSGDATDESELDVVETQTDFSEGVQPDAVVREYIRSNPDLHRKVLAYEPIWLEDFRNEIRSIRGVKLKLSDIVDCFDAECISFRCESQRRTNRGRKRVNAKGTATNR